MYSVHIRPGQGQLELDHLEVNSVKNTIFGMFLLLKFVKKSNFDRNQLKLSTQHKYMYMHQIKL